MSDNWIGIIPRDPRFIPAPQAIEEAKRFFEKIAPEACKIGVEVDAVIQFRDCGANLQSIHCPECDATLSAEAWHEAMDSAFSEDGFLLSPVQLPCGHVANSVNDLRYEWEQGFSRFIIDALNPRIAELQPAQIKRFEEILDCSVKVIYRHL